MLFLFVCFCFLLRIAIEDSIARDFPSGSDSKEFTCNAGDLGSIPRLGRYPGDRNGYWLHYFCLENLTDKEAMGSQTVGHNWAINTFTVLHILGHKDHIQIAQSFSLKYWFINLPSGQIFFFFKESSLKKYLFLAVLCLRCYLGFL